MIATGFGKRGFSPFCPRYGRSFTGSLWCSHCILFFPFNLWGAQTLALIILFLIGGIWSPSNKLEQTGKIILGLVVVVDEMMKAYGLHWQLLKVLGIQ